MEYAAQTGYPLDLSVAIAAAKKARREDDLYPSTAARRAGHRRLAHGERVVENQEERLVAGAKTASPISPPASPS